MRRTVAEVVIDDRARTADPPSTGAPGVEATPVFVARQPMLDRAGRTVAHELLFRASQRAEQAVFPDGDVATAQVMSAALHHIGLDRLTGRAPAFVNVSARFLADPDLVATFPPDRVVLEVLEDVVPTSEVIAGARALLARGYRLALDDFVPDGPTAPLRDLAAFVKYDLDIVDEVTMRREIERDRAAGRLVVVERIETHDDRDLARDAGADWFQGWFFTQPIIVPGTRIPSNPLALLRLATEINRPDVDAREVVERVAQDVGLSLEVLRVVNSAATGLVRPVSSIQQAAVLVGLDRLRAWVALAVLASFDDRPAELVTVALARARCCELLAERARTAPATAFTAGMLSVVDAMTGVPLTEVLERIAVDDEIRAALLDRRGPLAALLASVVAVERARADGDLADDLDVVAAHWQATGWACQVTAVAGAG